jgi:ABC-type Na+ efflux pump permease subunit
MIVARSDLKMALEVKFVKYGLLGMAALGPIMSIVTVVGMVAALPVEGMLGFISAMVASLLAMMSIIPASLISANSLVGEREQNTLEPLLCTPLTDSELLNGKLLGAFLPSFILLVGGIILTFVGSNVILLLLGLPMVMVIDLAGFFLLLTAAPAMMIAVVFLMILISGRVKRVYEAYQTTGAVILIFIIPMLLPMMSLGDGGIGDPVGLANLTWLTNIVTLLISVILMAVTGVLALKRFNRDRMVSSV